MTRMVFPQVIEYYRVVWMHTYQNFDKKWMVIEERVKPSFDN